MKSYTLHPNGAMIEYKPRYGVAFNHLELLQAVKTEAYVAIPFQGSKVMILGSSVNPRDVNAQASELLKAKIIGVVLVCERSMIC